MSDNWFTTIFTGKTTEGDVVSATTMNVTKIVPFFLTIPAAITQWLDAQDKITLSTNQMITIWLVLAGLTVALVATDMICRTWGTVRGASVGDIDFVGNPAVKVNLPRDGQVVEKDAVLHRLHGAFAQVELVPSKEEILVPVNSVHS